MIAEEQYDLLKPLVNENTVELIKKQMPWLSVEQKKLISINRKEIIMIEPYMFQKAADKPTGRVFVKLGIIYQVVPGLSVNETLYKAISPNNSLLTKEELLTKAIAWYSNVIIADYRLSCSVVLLSLSLNLIYVYIIKICKRVQEA
jgi:hypothetical protein